MKLYRCEQPDCYEDCLNNTSMLVWAEAAEQALDYYLEHNEDGRTIPREDITVEEKSVHFNPEEMGAHREGRLEVERLCGFRMHGDRSCDTCGLYEFDGSWPVCEGCGQCPDCRDEGCKTCNTSETP